MDKQHDKTTTRLDKASKHARGIAGDKSKADLEELPTPRRYEYMNKVRALCQDYLSKLPPS
jgi:hypothetical protein